MALTITGLSKTYSNGVQALKNLSLTIGNNMFGLLGPNGAGKTTLMRTIATLQDPDSGTILLNGIDVVKRKDAVRRLLGYLPQEFGVYPRISALDMLDHLAVMKGITKSGERKEMVDALLNQTNLWDARKKALSTYSGGMKQRFGIAQALLANPKLIIVDEPTAGLDPAERNRFLNLLSSIGPQRDRDPLHAHRRRRPRTLPAHGHHQQRQVAARGRARGALERSRGRIWSKVVATDDASCAASSAVQGGLHASGRRRARNPRPLRRHPGDGFRPVDPDLEDVYFLNLHASTSDLTGQLGPRRPPCFWISFSFEIKLRLKSISTYVYFVLWFLLTFFSIVGAGFRPCRRTARCCSTALTRTLQFIRQLRFLRLIIIAAIFGTSILRDFQRDTYQLSSPSPSPNSLTSADAGQDRFVTLCSSFPA